MNKIKKNLAIQLKECRRPRIGGGLLLSPATKPENKLKLIVLKSVF